MMTHEAIVYYDASHSENGNKILLKLDNNQTLTIPAHINCYFSERNTLNVVIAELQKNTTNK